MQTYHSSKLLKKMERSKVEPNQVCSVPMNTPQAYSLELPPVEAGTILSRQTIPVAHCIQNLSGFVLFCFFLDIRLNSSNAI